MKEGARCEPLSEECLTDISDVSDHTLNRDFDLYLCYSSSTTEGYLLEVFIRLWIASLVRISTSAWS